MKKIFGVFCVVWAVIFAVYETSYFGNNLLPHTLPEVLCDLTALILLIAGNVCLYHKPHK